MLSETLSPRLPYLCPGSKMGGPEFLFHAQEAQSSIRIGVKLHQSNSSTLFTLSQSLSAKFKFATMIPNLSAALPLTRLSNSLSLSLSTSLFFPAFFSDSFSHSLSLSLFISILASPCQPLFSFSFNYVESELLGSRERGGGQVVDGS